MKRIVFPLLVAAFTVGVFDVTSAQEKKDDMVMVTGWVTDTHCGAKGAVEGHAECAAKCVKEKDAKWALYNPEDKTLLVLTDQEKGSQMVGKKIICKGIVDKKKKEIKVTEYNWS